MAESGECQHCHCTKPLTKHHIVPKSQGGKLTKGNVEYLCLDCHREVERERKERTKTPIKREPIMLPLSRVPDGWADCTLCEHTVRPDTCPVTTGSKCPHIVVKDEMEAAHAFGHFCTEAEEAAQKGAK